MANFVIDKSRFNDEQLAQYEALVAIGKAEVDPEANKGACEEEVPPAVPPKKKPTEKEEVDPMETKKSAPTEIDVPQFVKDAIAKSEKFMEDVEKKEMVELAKKYDVLGQKPEELGEQLYNLKKSDEAMYKTCISMLDGQVALIEKSPLFAEIGKSGRNGGSVVDGVGGGAVAKAEAKAREIQKACPEMSFDAAIAKAWEDNPELMDEYDAEYFGN